MQISPLVRFASELALLLTPAAAVVHAQAASAAAFPVSIRVDAAQVRGELKPIYRFFGADEPNYATMKDGRKLLRDIDQLDGPASVEIANGAAGLKFSLPRRGVSLVLLDWSGAAK
jgi:hypothetical protein